jgi:hypothetical protein
VVKSLPLHIARRLTFQLSRGLAQNESRVSPIHPPPTVPDASIEASITHGGLMLFRHLTYSLFAKVFLSVTLGILLFGCTARYIQDFKPKSSQEEAIKAILIAFEMTWNSHEEKDVLALLDDDFIMWAWRGGSRNIVFRKGTFGFRLRDILIRWRYLSLGMPEISIRDGEVTAHTAMSVDGRAVRSTFRFINRGDNWVILELEF